MLRAPGGWPGVVEPAARLILSDEQGAASTAFERSKRPAAHGGVVAWVRGGGPSDAHGRPVRQARDLNGNDPETSSAHAPGPVAILPQFRELSITALIPSAGSIDRLVMLRNKYCYSV